MASPTTHTAPTATDCVNRLVRTRERTLAVIEGVSEHDLTRVHTPILSPIVWDLAHVAAFADLWLAQLQGTDMLRPELATTYDAGATPRARRATLPLLDVAGARAYLQLVDDALHAALHRLDLSPTSSEPLLRNAYLVDLLVEHEEQHRETILQALHVADAGTLQAGPPPAWATQTPAGPLMVDIPATTAILGTSSGFSYDNERPAHEVTTEAFRIDRTPVTIGAYAEFIADGGYDDPRHWGAESWTWRCEEQIERPMFWQADGSIRRFDRTERPDPSTPIMNISWHEADAYARWRGARLPTEREWEVAARYVPGDATDSPHSPDAATPSNNAPGSGAGANLDGHALGPLPPNPVSATPSGALAMIGDVWEWTSSPLRGYPGFRAFPYPEYSEVFFDGPYRVLRGGSWATATCCARTTFRNWDYPQRRQIFAGLRCAQDA